MKDLYLRFDSHEVMMDALRLSNMTQSYEDKEFVKSGGHDYAAWEVGEIPGVEGWHLNIRVVSPDFDYSALEPYLVIPKNPRVVWS